MAIADASFSSDEENEDEILQELFAAGKLKPGLNIPVPVKKYVNDVPKLKETYENIKKELPWIERLDLVNDMAELAPELAVAIHEQEQFVKSGRSNPIALNEFKRETLFHRQAQLAAIEGISRLRSQGVPTIRPDDYFAEMMKSDEHMQKVRRSLLQKQAGLERSEKVKKMRMEKKLMKQKQTESILRKQKEKRNLSEEIKKYRKGARADLDFLENKPKSSQRSSNKSLPNKRNGKKFNSKEDGKKFNEGSGKKFRGSSKGRRKEDGNGRKDKRKFQSRAQQKNKRPGKSRRKNMKKGP